MVVELAAELMIKLMAELMYLHDCVGARGVEWGVEGAVGCGRMGWWPGVGLGWWGGVTCCT